MGSIHIDDEILDKFNEVLIDYKILDVQGSGRGGKTSDETSQESENSGRPSYDDTYAY